MNSFNYLTPTPCQVPGTGHCPGAHEGFNNVKVLAFRQLALSRGTRHVQLILGDGTYVKPSMLEIPVLQPT